MEVSISELIAGLSYFLLHFEMAEKAIISHSNTSEEKNIDSPLDVSDVEEIKRLDTVQNDEALKVVGQYGGDETWTEDEEKGVLKKIDRALMPILCITYGLQYYDKSMLGQAVSLTRYPDI